MTLNGHRVKNSNLDNVNHSLELLTVSRDVRLKKEDWEKEKPRNKIAGVVGCVDKARKPKKKNEL